MSAILHIQTIVSVPFYENTYVVWRDKRTEALVIDPGLEPDLILTFLEEQQLQPVVLLNTHGHADHIGGNEALKQRYPHIPLLIGAGDAHMLTDAEANLSAPFGSPLTSPPADRLLSDGASITFAGITFEVLTIPGHSPGHVVFLYRAEPSIVFGGDVLFQSGIGRTDFPGGSTDQLLNGIRTKLFSLPDETQVYPGHGPSTTIGYEKRHNPFVGGDAETGPVLGW